MSEDAAFDITICNPPFFSSAEEMQEGQKLKVESAHAVRSDPARRRWTTEA